MFQQLFDCDGQVALVYCSKGNGIVCALPPLAFDAFLNVVLTCRSGGMSMPLPPASTSANKSMTPLVG